MHTGTIHCGTRRRHLQAFLAGAAVGMLGGLIGLGGAEFRLPLLIGLFGFAALAAVIINKAMSLIVVTSALVFRAQARPPGSCSITGRSLSTSSREACWGRGGARPGRRGRILGRCTA